MSIEKEFLCWLRKENKTFKENLEFAIKALKSSEFTLGNKHEIVMKWISEERHIQAADVLVEDLLELLSLEIQPGQISRHIKNDFVEWFLDTTEQNFSGNVTTRSWVELLKALLQCELLQDLYRSNYELKARLYACVFKCYDSYLDGLQRNGKEFLSTYESDFFQSMMPSLKNDIKHTGELTTYEQMYTTHILEPLVQVILQFQKVSLDFLEELTEIEKLMTVELSDESLMQRIMNKTEPTRLFILECAVINRKNLEKFLQCLIVRVFDNMAEPTKADNQRWHLLMAASVLKIFNRHEVNLNIKLNNGQSALKFLSNELSNCIKTTTTTYFQEVLILLCCILQYNPLILEDSMFEITANVILSTKSGQTEEKELYEKYLELFINMFGHLYKAEKCITHFLKAINKHLESNEICTTSKKRKAQREMDEISNIKKRKTFGENEELETKEECSQILFQKLFQSLITTKTANYRLNASSGHSFSKLQLFWPSGAAGLTFSKLVASLLPKPSLSIWKTLLFSLQEFLQNLNNKAEFSECDLFHIDLRCALLCQYFAGCKVAEKYENHVDAMQSNRDLTRNVLGLFGSSLLQHEHETRLMAAFLELSHSFTSFEVIVTYYKSTAFSVLNESIHSFLSTQQWTLIEQRVLNFGKNSCKLLLKRLHSQRMQVQGLCGVNPIKNCQNPPAVSRTVLNDADQLNAILKSSNAEWFILTCNRSDKKIIAKYIIKHYQQLPLAYKDEELLSYIVLGVYENICKNIPIKQSKFPHLLAGIEKMFECMKLNDCEILMKSLIETAISTNDDENLKHLESEGNPLNVSEIEKDLHLLTQLPLAQLELKRKTIFFVIHLLIYNNFKLLRERNLYQQAYVIMQDFLHFGPRIVLFNHIPANYLLQILPVNKCRDFYELLFDWVANSKQTDTEQFLEEVSAILKKSMFSNNTLTKDETYLLLMSIKAFSCMDKRHAKGFRKSMEEFLYIFDEYIKMHVKEKDFTTTNKEKFILKTLPAMPAYVSSMLKGEQNIDTEFRRIIKIYIGLSMNNFSNHFVNLMQLALNHREQLHLDQEEIEFILTNCWTQLNEILTKNIYNWEHQDATIESMIKIIISNKSNEDFLLCLRNLLNRLEEECCNNVFPLLMAISKCTFSMVKGAIFNEQYKIITHNIALSLINKQTHSQSYYESLIMLLHCHLAFASNKTVPITMDTLDGILNLLIHLNLANFPFQHDNIKQFHTLYTAAVEVTSTLMKQHHMLIIDRTAQYMHILKDLIQAIMSYKNDYRFRVALPATELDMLCEFMFKLETLMNMITTQHCVPFKRLAPFALLFIINLFVTGKSPTIQNMKIKTHIEAICHDLIRICDYRAGHFILRSSTEAGRKFYESLVADYHKYHKFKGKV